MSENDTLFEKYLTNRLSPEEQQALANLLEDERVREEFIRYSADWTLTAGVAQQYQQLARERQRQGPAVGDASGGPWRRLAPTLALAASVLVVAGIFFLRKPPPASGLVRAVRTIGQVQVAGTRFATATGSYCRVDLNDGTRLALDQNSSVSVSRHVQSGATTVTRDAGNLYLDVTRQKNPFFIQSGIMNVTVLGTKLHVGATPAGQPWVDVLEGFIRVINGESGAYLGQGQTGVAAAREASYDLLTVRSSQAAPDALSWVRQLALTAPAAAAEASPPEMTGGYRIRSGMWQLDSKDGHVVVTQEKETGDRELLFGAPLWAKGTVTCRFRVLRTSSPDAAVGLILHYSDTDADVFSVKEPLPRLTAYNSWINVRMEFEIGQDNDTTIHLMDFWPEGHPEAKWSIPEGAARSRTPANSPIRQRRACNIGLFTSGCSAEFADLAAGPIYLAGTARASRVTRLAHPDLIALWSFQNGSSNVVKDISGVGEPMDLAIGKPENVQWLKDSLRVTGAADIHYRGNARKLRDAWRKTSGMTIEFWIRSPEKPEKHFAEPQRFICLTTGDGGFIWWNQRFEADRPSQAMERDEKDGPSRLYGHDAVAYLEDGTSTLVARSSGPLVSDVTRSVVLKRHLAIHERPDPIGFHLAPSFDTGTSAKFPWKGDLIAVAIYGRPFTARELTDARDRSLTALIPDAFAAEHELPTSPK